MLKDRYVVVVLGYLDYNNPNFSTQQTSTPLIQ